MIHFDHIEIHVTNSLEYSNFLLKLFNTGRFKKISENNTYMFLLSDNLRFEIKESKLYKDIYNINNGIGFCLPCLRMKNAIIHLKNFDNITISKIIKNPDGDCIFFKDFQGIDWHIKDYEILDIFTNI